MYQLINADKTVVEFKTQKEMADHLKISLRTMIRKIKLGKYKDMIIKTNKPKKHNPLATLQQYKLPEKCTAECVQEYHRVAMACVNSHIMQKYNLTVGQLKDLLHFQSNDIELNDCVHCKINTQGTHLKCKTCRSVYHKKCLPKECLLCQNKLNKVEIFYNHKFHRYSPLK